MPCGKKTQNATKLRRTNVRKGYARIVTRRRIDSDELVLRSSVKSYSILRIFYRNELFNVSHHFFYSLVRSIELLLQAFLILSLLE